MQICRPRLSWGLSGTHALRLKVDAPLAKAMWRRKNKRCAAQELVSDIGTHGILKDLKTYCKLCEGRLDLSGLGFIGCCQARVAEPRSVVQPEASGVPEADAGPEVGAIHPVLVACLSEFKLAQRGSGVFVPGRR